VRNLAIVGVAAVVACGRLGFDDRLTGADAPVPGGDAVPIDAAHEVPRLVSMTGSSTNDGSDLPQLVVTIPEVAAGDLVVVGIAEHHGDPIASVEDGSGRQLESADVRAQVAGTSSEIWYETDAAATTSITITPSVASDFDAWVAEFSGTRAGAPAAAGSNCLEYPPSIVMAPGTTTVAGELVFSVTMLEYPVYVAQVLPPFTGFPPLTGNDAGFYVAPAPGSYGTQFEIASGSGMAAMTCASTAVWAPGP
jgi:hypothetical protein